MNQSLPHFKALTDVHFYCSATILDFMSFHGRVSPHEVLHFDWHLFLTEGKLHLLGLNSMAFKLVQTLLYLTSDKMIGCSWNCRRDNSMNLQTLTGDTPPSLDSNFLNFQYGYYKLWVCSAAESLELVKYGSISRGFSRMMIGHKVSNVMGQMICNRMSVPNSLVCEQL